MADQFVILPAHYLAGIQRYEDAQDAAVAAAEAVAKDKAPRAVVQVHSEVRATHEPRVVIAHVA